MSRDNTQFDSFVDNFYKSYRGCKPCIKLFIDDYCEVFGKSKVSLMCHNKLSKIGMFFHKTRGENWPHYYQGYCEGSWSELVEVKVEK